MDSNEWFFLATFAYINNHSEYLGLKEMNFASFELKTIKFIKFLKANFQQNIHQFVGIRNEDFTF